ncbi:hypothetical protein Btru_076217 [Bulinus truncatus]|nr:hypothetical protein Btru_076217 [Bulinus truncatus]
MFYLGIIVVIIYSFQGNSHCVEIKKNCTEIKSFANGQVSLTKSYRLLFSCNSDFDLYGTEFMVCSDQGLWSPEFPTCIKTGCKQNIRLKYGNVHKGTKKYLGKLLSFTCRSNYQLIGADRLLCDGNKWSGPAPVCKPFAVQSEEYVTDFETNLFNGWTQGNDDQIDWVRWSGNTPSNGTGPSTDHTLKTSDGHYVYIETSHAIAGDSAKLYSMTFPDVYSNDRCIEFYYHSHGDNTGRLTVNVKPYNLAEKNIFSIQGLSNDNWIRGYAAIGRQTKAFQIVFQATVGGFYGNIAIDDIKLFKCSKVTTPAPTSAFTTEDSTFFTTVASETSVQDTEDAQTTTHQPTMALPTESTSSDPQITTEITGTLNTLSETLTPNNTTVSDSIIIQSTHDEVTQGIVQGTTKSDNFNDSFISDRHVDQRQSNYEATTAHLQYGASNRTFSVSETLYSGIDASISHHIFTTTQQTKDDEDISEALTKDISEIGNTNMNNYRTTSENIDSGLPVRTSSSSIDNNSDNTDKDSDNTDNEISDDKDNAEENSNFHENSSSNIKSDSKEKRNDNVGNVVGLVGSLIAVILAVGILVLGLRAWKRRRASKKPEPSQPEVGELKEIVVEEQSPVDPGSQQSNQNVGAGDITVVDVEKKNEIQDSGNEKQECKIEESLVESGAADKLFEEKSLEVNSIEKIEESKESQPEIKDMKTDTCENKLESTKENDDASLVNCELKNSRMQVSEERKPDPADTTNEKQEIVDVTNDQETANIHRSDETWDLTKTEEEKTEESKHLGMNQDAPCAETDPNTTGTSENDLQVMSKEKGFTFSLFKNLFHRKEKKAQDNVQPNVDKDELNKEEKIPDNETEKDENDVAAVDLPVTKFSEEGAVTEQVKEKALKNMKKLKKDKQKEERQRKKEERKKQKEEKKSKKKQLMKGDEQGEDKNEENEEKVQSSNEKDQVSSDKDKPLNSEDQDLIEKGNVLTDKDNNLHEKDEVLNDKDEVLNDKDQVLNDKDQVLNDKDQVLNDKDQVLNDKDQVLNDKDQVSTSVRENVMASTATDNNGVPEKANAENNVTAADKSVSEVHLFVQEVIKEAQDDNGSKVNDTLMKDNSIVEHL